MINLNCLILNIHYLMEWGGDSEERGLQELL